MMTAITWFPWWAQLLAGIVLLVLGVAYLLMPFAVFGVKPRLDEIELQLGEIRAELRVIAMRLSGDETPQPARPADFAPPRAADPMLRDPPYAARTEGPSGDPRSDRRADTIPFDRPHAASARSEGHHPEPIRSEPTRPDPRVARASDDWSASSASPPRVATPRVGPVRLNDPWAEPSRREPPPAAPAPHDRADRDGPRRDPHEASPYERVDSFLASENETGRRAAPSVAADRAYDDMPPEGLGQTVRPTYFEPPGHDPRRSAPPQSPPVQPPVASPQSSGQSADGPGTGPDHRAPFPSSGEAPWRRREELSPRMPDERPASDDDDTWRRPRSEPTLRWPPRD